MGEKNKAVTRPNFHECTFCKRQGFVYQDKEHAEHCKRWFKDRNSQLKQEKKEWFLKNTDYLLLPRVLFSLIADYWIPNVPKPMFLFSVKQTYASTFRLFHSEKWEPQLLGVWRMEEDPLFDVFNIGATKVCYARPLVLCYGCATKVSVFKR